MSRTLRLHFNTVDGEIKFNILDPVEELDQDAVKAAMEAVVASGAFEGIVSVNKAVLTTTDSETIYEA